MKNKDAAFETDKTNESDQNNLRKNSESFKKDFNGNKSNGSNNLGSDFNLRVTDKKPSQVPAGEQSQANPKQANQAAAENSALAAVNADLTDSQTDHDGQTETMGNKKEAAADQTDITSKEIDPSETETDASDESTSPDADADRQRAEKSEGTSTAQPDTEQPSDTSPDEGADLPTTKDPETILAEESADADLEEEIAEASATGPSLMKITATVTLIVVLFCGFFIFENESRIKKGKTEKSQTPKDEQQPSIRERKEVLDIQVVAATNVYDSQINDISALRDILLKKQAEVLALKQRYQRSIAELEKEILDEQRRSGVHNFLQATGNKRIVYTLKTIQRRQAYIGQLEMPLAWVSGACEELLYLKRRVVTDLQVSVIASGIDMNSHAQQMQQALEKYQPTADRLAIDFTEARLESLETIWQQVQNKHNHSSPEQVYSRNEIIANQICAGDFDRIGELTEISALTAKCINQMNGSDLFLNQITEISPGAAKQLCQWNGSWLCMNGIRALSPRVAHYLFQWNGDWMSLNGLTEFPAEIGEQLLKWGGGQLELMGLQNAADSDGKIEIKYLAEWEQSGGKLFVPKNIREKIDARTGNQVQ